MCPRWFLRQACTLAIVSSLALAPSPLWAASATNTWTDTNPTPTTRWMPKDFYNCTGTATTSNPEGRAYSGSAFGMDQNGNGHIFYFGGGHQSYPGNDVDLYDIRNNIWINDADSDPVNHSITPIPAQCVAAICINNPITIDNYPSGAACKNPPVPYDPSCLMGSCGIPAGMQVSKAAVGLPVAGTPCPTCRPYTTHTYQQEAFNPNRGTFMVYLESGTWEWSPTTRSWTWLGVPPPQCADPSDRLLIWYPAQNPANQRMLYFQFGGGSSGVYWFDYAMNVWKPYDSTIISQTNTYYLPTGNGWYEPFGFWNGHANKFVISTHHGSLGWYVYDPDPSLKGAAAWTDITATAPLDVKSTQCSLDQGICMGGTKGGSVCDSNSNCTGGGVCDKTPSCFTTGITYDAGNQRTIVLTQDRQGTKTLALWAYDAVNNTWQKVPTSGGTGITANSGYPNQLHYDPKTASLYLVDLIGFWSAGPGATVRTRKITLDLGNLPATLSGDLDANGIVDLFDLQHLVNVLLGLETNPKADVNGDGLIDILDLQALVNLLLGA